MSWHYSRALVEGFLGDASWDGVPCAPLKTTNTPDLYSSHGKTTGASNRSRYGMTCEPLMDDLGTDLLTWFREASRAKTSPKLARVPVFRAKNRDCGKKWRVSFAKWNPDLSLWRTSQRSLLGGWMSFSETWPRWGSMQNGVCWEHITPEHLTSVIGSGLWPTPTKLIQQEDPESFLKRQEKWRGTYSNGIPLDLAVKIVPSHAKPAGNFGANGAYAIGRSVDVQVPMTEMLSTVLRNWPTPNARDYKDHGANVDWQKVASKSKLAGVVMVRQNNQAGGSMNPPWVAWLMGWPVGWTDLKPLAMDKFRLWLRSHGGC